ncbi:MAG TPA: DUF6522 family protein [Dokdonella sp.]|uniref:DUF6522 family protein n=1 Tax=Dokdonella sp. TaxID=2291710 RepID=UPI0025C022D7|nr:DUF6522 family protein [Dokdonella sp.]MBX3691915.1 hypothetical protein [Dokdonella sp.]HNR90845.1 DUF6522 family protein [Dokdonella sp.]
MAKRIPLHTTPAPEIEIDGAIVAQAFGLDVATFRTLMEQQRITQLCERGTGEDAGRHRASFYLDRRRVRIVVDRDGRLCAPIEQGRSGRDSGPSTD